MKLTFFENLGIIKELFLKNNELYGILLLFILVLFIFISDTKVKMFKKVTNGLLIYIILIGTLFIFYPDITGTLFKTLINGIIKLVIEPNIVLYTAIITVSQFMMLQTLYYEKDKVLKIINSTIYIIINMLFIITIWYMKKGNIKIDDMFLSTQLTSIIKISVTVFIVWLVLLFLRKVAKIIVMKRDNYNKYLSSEKAYEKMLYNLSK